MRTKKIPKYEVERHPFEPFLVEDSTHLILGTFPTYRKNFDFYYSGSENHFWEILEQIFNHRLEHYTDPLAVIERKSFLKKHSISMADMHSVCYRKNKSSSDTELFPIILTDIFSILENVPTIKTLILTSRTQVVGTLGLLNTYFMQQGKPSLIFDAKEGKILKDFFEFNNRKIDVFVPYSPSARVAKEGRTTPTELYNMYKMCLNR